MANYFKIEEFSVNNGSGVGVSIFFSGCDKEPKCKGCFNSEAWSFNVGQPFTRETVDKILDLLRNPHISHLSILGGEPLAYENIAAVAYLCHAVKLAFFDKKVWLWTHYTWKDLTGDDWFYHYLLKDIDVLVDGEYIEEQRDLTLAFKGSSNQRTIDVQESLKQNKIVLYED